MNKALPGVIFLGSLLCCLNLSAQSLPVHRALRILIVSDEVNPHGLSDSDLTQPGDLSVALAATPALNLSLTPEALLEINTDQIEQATARLAANLIAEAAYDVLIYFAHRIPAGPDGAARQEAFVAAATGFVTRGGGIVSFHHGIYRTAGKESMQALLGAEATGSVPYDQVDGQNVIAVGGNDFICSWDISYPGTIAYADASFSVSLADYNAFNNTPDERYPALQLLANPAHIIPLFASNYATGDATHILGYRYQRPEWQGQVVMYQPGEYQPNALDPTGNNFQILLNAIYAVAPPDELVFQDGFETAVP